MTTASTPTYLRLTSMDILLYRNHEVLFFLALYGEAQIAAHAKMMGTARTVPYCL